MSNDNAGVPVPADLPPATPAGKGMFGIQGTGDTSGYGGLVRRQTLAHRGESFGQREVIVSFGQRIAQCAE